MRKKCLITFIYLLVATSGLAGIEMTFEQIVTDRVEANGPIGIVAFVYDGGLFDVSAQRVWLEVNYGKQPENQWLDYNATSFSYWNDVNVDHFEGYVNPKCLVFSTVVKHLHAGHQVMVISLRKTPVDPLTAKRTDELSTNEVFNQILRQAEKLNINVLPEAIRNLSIKFVSGKQLPPILLGADIVYSDRSQEYYLGPDGENLGPQFIRILHTGGENRAIEQKIASDERVLGQSDTVCPEDQSTSTTRRASTSTSTTASTSILTTTTKPTTTIDLITRFPSTDRPLGPQMNNAAASWDYLRILAIVAPVAVMTGAIVGLVQRFYRQPSLGGIEISLDALPSSD
jgi:hypothetical protein